MSRFLRPLYALPGLACVLSAGLILGIFLHMSALTSGQEIIIPARGYDPRDLLLGHYVRLRPDSDVVLDAGAAERARKDFGLKGQYLDSRQGWAVMEKSGDRWVPVQISRDRPDLSHTETRVLLYGDMQFRNTKLETASPGSLTVSPPIDIDRYYVHADEAKALEALLWQNGPQDQQSHVDIILSVSDDGTALLKGIRIDGERHTISWW